MHRSIRLAALVCGIVVFTVGTGLADDASPGMEPGNPGYETVQPSELPPATYLPTPNPFPSPRPLPLEPGYDGPPVPLPPSPPPINYGPAESQ